MDLVVLSDTHGLHRQVSFPYGELLLHASDFTFKSRSMTEVQDFNC